MTGRCLASPEDTESLGQEVARWLQPRAGAVIYLRGPLGAGKTTLARGLLRQLQVKGPIRSPTYTLLEPYDIGGKPLIHLDLYRLADPLEAEQLGLADYPPESCWWLVEWPERGAPLLPPASLTVTLEHAKGGRRAQIQGLS